MEQTKTNSFPETEKNWCKYYIIKSEKAQVLLWIWAFSFGHSLKIRFTLRIRHAFSGGYANLNDLQSVHSLTVGFTSWVPTVMQSKEQKSFSPQWYAHCCTVHLIEWFSLHAMLFSSRSYIHAFSERMYFQRDE